MSLMQDKLKSLKTELESVIEIIDGLDSYNEIPEIDIDLIKQKIIKSYENIILINYSKNNETQKLDTSDVEKIDNEELTNFDEKEEDFEIKIIETIEDAPEDAKEYYNKVIKEREKEVNNPVFNKTVEKKESSSQEKKEVITDNNKNSILISIFKSIENSTDVSSKLQFKPINDVKTAISINDKIGYISEIFDGDAEKFNICLSKINNAANINIVIDELKNKIDWDEENLVHKSFLEIIYRKFM